MNTKIYASYLRVSTQKQGRSQLGLSSQRDICNGFIKHNGGTLGQEFVDVESGTHRNRKGLWDAINYCNENSCPLVIATLSRLARDVEFCFKVVNTGVEIHFVDMPQVSTLLLGIFATVAQYERELTSQRTRNALGELKKKGVRLGASNDKYVENRNNKSKEQLLMECRRRGETKTRRFLEKKDTVAFIKVLRKCFPEHTQGELTEWDWKGINTKDGVRQQVLGLMKDFKELDSTIFVRWQLENLDEVKLQCKLANMITSIKRSALKLQLFNNNNNSNN